MRRCEIILASMAFLWGVACDGQPCRERAVVNNPAFTMPANLSASFPLSPRGGFDRARPPESNRMQRGPAYDNTDTNDARMFWNLAISASSVHRSKSENAPTAMLVSSRLLSPALGAQGENKTIWDGVYALAQSKQGESLYQAKCGSCHGDTLEGGEMAPPLAGGDFQANWNGLSVGDLFDRIQVSMPADHPGSLTHQQSVLIVAFILKMNKCPAGKDELPNDPESLKQIRFEPTKDKK
jgi:hypothetical protein